MKGVPLPIEGIRKVYLFGQKWYIKGQGVGPRGGASLSKFVAPAAHGAFSSETFLFLFGEAGVTPVGDRGY